MRGRLITFEGIEGSGKSTQAAKLAKHLRAKGVRVHVTREPGGVRLGEDIRRILLDPTYRGKLSAPSELFLYEAARAQHVAQDIRPALARGEWVVCDRFCDASLAYQGYGRGLSIPFVRAANDFAASGLVPDRTFLLDLRVSDGMDRVRGRGKRPDRLEREHRSFHRRVRLGYLEIARSEPRRVRVVDASERMDSVFAAVVRGLPPLPRHRRLR